MATDPALVERLSTLLKGSPCDGLKLILACPTYGHADPECQKDVRVALMSSFHHGIAWYGDASTERFGYSASRNAVARLTWEDKSIDGVVWVDSDIRMESTAIALMVGSAVHYKADFVSGVYHQRLPPYRPVLYHFKKETQGFYQLKDYPENAFFPTGGCGFGFVYTHRRVIDAIAQHKGFVDKEGWFPDKRDTGGFGEDLAFCYQAIKAGQQLYVATNVQVGHVGEPSVVTREDFLREKARMEAEGINEVVPA